MVNIQKSGDSAIKFTFTDNDRYLYDGEITVPLNSLILVFDESNMAVFKKIDGDVFLTFLIGNSNFSSKSDLETFYKENMVGSTGGGVDSGTVQTMIDSSISGLAESSAVTEEITAAVSGKADSSVVTSLNGVVTGHTADTTIHVTSNDKEKWNKVDDKLDASAYTPTDLSQYWTSAETENAITAAVSGKADTSDVSTLSGQVETDEKVTATALNALNNGLSGATTSINNVSSTLNNHTGNSEIHISSADRNNWNGKVGYDDVTNTVQKDSNELVEGGGIFNKVAYTTTASSVVTSETTNTTIGLYRIQPDTSWGWINSVDEIQNWCLELPEGSCDLDGGELRMLFNRDISELDITIGDMGGNSFTVRYDSNEDNLEADNATVEWADATTKREIIITDYPTISLEELDGELTSDATVIPVEEKATSVKLKYVYSSEQTIETTHWVVDKIKDKADTSAVTASIAAAVSGKQDTLVAGTNIKTINNESILGSGNINIQGGSSINVVQTTGSSSADVMSQSAVTSSINAVSGAIPTTYINSIQPDGDAGYERMYRFSTPSNFNYFILRNAKINGRQVLNKGYSIAINEFNLVETSAITTSVTSASTDSQVPSAKAVYDQLGGLKLVQISQSDYDALATKDASTLYIITNNS